MNNRSPPRDAEGLLATRVVTLDQFKTDDATARNGESSSTLKPIPVLLLPGETTEQYDTKFRRWVFDRKVSTELLNNEPAVERQYRLDFADSRAWTLSRKGIGTMSSHHLDKYEGVRSREELLSQQVMTVEQFVEKMAKFGPNGYLNTGWRLKRIPIVLRPRETKLIYELNFQRWLGKKDVTLEMLREDPEEERRYRQCFAYTRVKLEQISKSEQKPQSKPQPKLEQKSH
ncbi:hypothetical protein PHYSODRAFT_320877 [Phytophthora sojae]|uniref:Uncharacterized protein n=1 Tax=Phytophthora sojae (strain P6497) TaxID=1094619 RepID=G4YGQ9_PHYSP|nr:hypothetical protein PHYSODRAFT_320877 [Phytophthora sojae]EGZ27018.1 hypothetical protein PHYSODRAFT_320877 [Phytophthora sojae]|eukprot:XP_009514293.1 hypothetical protein PHYSODRAFT_320877 [Phytophthora sojae]